MRWRQFNIENLVKSRKMPFSVIPAEAGIQCFQTLLDSRLRGSDEFWDFLRVYQYSIHPVFELERAMRRPGAMSGEWTGLSSFTDTLFCNNRVDLMINGRQ